jgi:hypothetical protein
VAAVVAVFVVCATVAGFATACVTAAWVLCAALVTGFVAAGAGGGGAGAAGAFAAWVVVLTV